MKSHQTIASIGAFLALAVSAQAATITFNDTINVTETGTLNGSNVISLSQFDSNLGTLEGVTITLTLSLPSFDIVVDNDSVNPANVTASFGTLGGVGFSSTASTLNTGFATISGSNFTIATQSDSFTVQGNDTDSTASFDNDAGPDNGTFSTVAVNVGESSWEISSVVFSQYESGTPGVISFEIAPDFVTDLNINSGGGGGETRFQGSIPTGTFFAEVTYTYSNPVPEPSSFALIAGFFGLTWVMVRRRS